MKNKNHLLTLFCIVVFLLALTNIIAAQTVPGYTVTIFENTIPYPRDVSTDNAGNVYTMRLYEGDVYKISPSGVVSMLINLESHFYVGPHFDRVSGNIFISHYGHGPRNEVWKLTPAGDYSMFASGIPYTSGITSDGAGNLYASSYMRQGKVSKVTPSGQVSVFATGLKYPDPLAVGPGGDLFIGNRGTGQVMRVPSSGGVATVFASGFSNPIGLDIDSQGNIFVANTGNGTISKVTPTGVVSEFGSGFPQPCGLAFDPSGNLFVATYGTGGRIYKVSSSSPPANNPPDCSGAAIADQAADDNCQVTISADDVTGVTDPDGDELTITVDPTTLDLGDNYVTVTADDGNGGTCSSDIIVNVEDNTAPALTVDTETLGMWPPNHKYKTFTVDDFDVSAIDNCAGNMTSDVVITNVASDEPDDAKGGGDGNTKNDIVIVNDYTVKLRAERQGGGDGRVYTIYLSASDGSNTSTATCQVIVPHDRSGLPKNISSRFVGDDMVIPGDYQLSQNYPNPFNPTTEITFALPQAESVKLSIYNTNGQLIRTLANGFFSEGFHSVMWNATDESGSRVTSGMYVYVLRAGEVVLQDKMLLMK